MGREVQLRRNRSALSDGRLFGTRRQGPHPGLLVFWCIAMLAVGIVIWQFNNIQPKVLAMVGSKSTPTPMAADFAHRGDLAFWRGDLNAAVENYTIAANQSPLDVNIGYELIRMLIYRSYGDIRQKADDVKNASTRAKTLAKTNPDNSRAQAINCYAQLRNDESDSAVRSCVRAIELNGNDGDAHAFLSMAQFDLQRYAAALDEAKKAVDLTPTSIDANLAYARALTFYGRNDSALDYFRKAAEVNTQLEFPYYELASLARRIAIKNDDESKFLVAIGAYETVLRMTGANNVKALTRICQAYLEKASRTEEDITQARLFCRKATTVDATYPLAWRWYGEVLHNSRDYEDAIDAFAQCVELEKGFDVKDRDSACWWLQAADYYVLSRPATNGKPSDCEEAVKLNEDVLKWATEDNAINQANKVIAKCATGGDLQNYKTPTPIPTATPKPAPIL